MWKNTPAYWYTEYTHVESKDVFVDKLSTDTLRQCAINSHADLKVIDEYFESELEEALAFVAKGRIQIKKKWNFPSLD